MLIKIDCVYGDKVVVGDNHFDKSDLQKAVEEILKVADEREFPSVFCSRYGYEEVQNPGNIHADYLIDLDTSMVFTLVFGQENSNLSNS